MQTNQKRVQSARASRELQEKKLEAEEKKQAAGMSTSFFVFQAQRDLSQARTAEIQAISDYNKSLVDFEAVQLAPINGSAGQRHRRPGSRPSGGQIISGQQQQQSTGQSADADCGSRTPIRPALSACPHLPSPPDPTCPAASGTLRRVPKLSVTVITRNEAADIGDALASVAWADEIVVVDSESTDETVAIARRHTDRVVVREWPGYVDQKNHAASIASHDWILSLDADERVTPALAEEIKALMAGAPARRRVPHARA